MDFLSQGDLEFIGQLGWSDRRPGRFPDRLLHLPHQGDAFLLQVGQLVGVIDICVSCLLHLQLFGERDGFVCEQVGHTDGDFRVGARYFQRDDIRIALGHD